MTLNEIVARCKLPISVRWEPGSAHPFYGVFQSVWVSESPEGLHVSVDPAEATAGYLALCRELDPAAS